MSLAAIVVLFKHRYIEINPLPLHFLRWYDAHQVIPLFPFGYGLSYTSFSYDNIRVITTVNNNTNTATSANSNNSRNNSAVAVVANIEVTICNTGSRAGQEVVQMYLSYPTTDATTATAVLEPLKQLRGFFKTSMLLPAATTSVKFTLTQRDVSIWDAEIHAWVPVSGTFRVLVGASSLDIKLQADLLL